MEFLNEVFEVQLLFKHRLRKRIIDYVYGVCGAVIELRSILAIRQLNTEKSFLLCQ
jgi:hypothetical protein